MKPEEIVDDRFRMPDAMWERIEVLLPKRRRRKVGGRPPLPWRLVIDGIFYVLRTGCQWKAAPKAFGSGSSLHRYFQVLVKRRCFADLWAMALLEYDDLAGTGVYAEAFSAMAKGSTSPTSTLPCFSRAASFSGSQGGTSAMGPAQAGR